MTKSCSNCTRSLPADLADEPNASFWVAARGEDGRPRRYHSWCKDCQRERVRVSAGLARRGRPYTPRRPGRTPEERREARRERYLREHAEVVRRRAEDPVYDEAVRREARERARSRRARERRFRRLRLDAAPFVAFLREEERRLGSRAALSRATGISPRRLYTFLRGYSRWEKNGRSGTSPVSHVTFEVADRALSLHGARTVFDLWPDLRDDPTT